MNEKQKQRYEERDRHISKYITIETERKLKNTLINSLISQGMPRGPLRAVPQSTPGFWW